MSILLILKLIGSLALLMFGMKSMSESLQKMAGSQLRQRASGDDDKPFHWHADGRFRHCSSAVFHSHHRDDRVIRQCRSPYSRPGDIHYHGC